MELFLSFSSSVPKVAGKVCPLTARIVGAKPFWFLPPLALGPLFSRRRAHRGGRLTPRAVNHIVKKLGRRAKLTPKLSPHWLRHAHASHSLDHGAPLSVVAATLGHANISTTSAYLHAKPGSASGDNLNPDIWKAS